MCNFSRQHLMCLSQRGASVLTVPRCLHIEQVLPKPFDVLPFREASVLSLRDTTDFPASVPDILGSGCPSVAGS